MSSSLHPRMTALFIGTAVSSLLLLVGVFAFRVTSSQVHAAGSTLFVGQSIGSDTDCTSPGFTSVQAAVDASTSGDTVYLCGTTPFSGQVIITKAITLTGDNGATIQAPNPFPATPSRACRLSSPPIICSFHKRLSLFGAQARTPRSST